MPALPQLSNSAVKRIMCNSCVILVNFTTKRNAEQDIQIFDDSGRLYFADGGKSFMSMSPKKLSNIESTASTAPWIPVSASFFYR